MNTIDEKLQRWQLNSQSLVGRNVFEQCECPAPQLARGEYLGRHRGHDHRGREDGHLKKNAACALRVDEHYVIVRLENGQKIAQSQSSVWDVQEQRVQLPLKII